MQNSDNLSEYVTQTNSDSKIGKLKHQNTQLLFQNIKLKQENEQLLKKLKEADFNNLKLQREL